MRASELAVYDWLFIEGEAQQVMPSLIDYVFCGQPVNLEPIPIDAEILEANGFELVQRKWGGMFRLYVDGGCYVYIDRDEAGLLELDTNTPAGDFSDCKIDYVHELQHLLRAAGFYDLADDFKIQ